MAYQYMHMMQRALCGKLFTTAATRFYSVQHFQKSATKILKEHGSDKNKPFLQTSNVASIRNFNFIFFSP